MLSLDWFHQYLYIRMVSSTNIWLEAARESSVALAEFLISFFDTVETTPESDWATLADPSALCPLALESVTVAPSPLRTDASALINPI